MAEIFVIGDTHFGHKNILDFFGMGLRNQFKNIDDHDECLVKMWNHVVGKKDVVIHLGDVAWTRNALERVGDCNGIKRLIMGNHDTYRAEEYSRFFTKLHGSYRKREILFTHIPILLDELRRYNYVCHGHIHDKMLNIKDWRYFNACADMIDLMPIPLEQIENEFKRRTIEQLRGEYCV
jgi:calcineurin-like phosphoesterase family protein